jgi:ABC-type phosphate transport system auxiliary subunit
MGDAGEGLVDAESRLAERMDEVEQERQKARKVVESGDPERTQQIESCRLARIEMQRQMELTANKIRKKQLSDGIAELDRRMTQVST